MFKAPNREFQPGFNAEETRRRRQNNSLSLRRKDRESKLQKKRQRILARTTQTSPNNNNNNTNNNTNNNHNNIINKKLKIQDLSKLTSGCFSNNISAQFECTRQFRMLLSSASNPPIRQVIDCGVVPRFIQFCRNNQYPELQYESLWALLNIASGPPECTAHIIRNGSHNVFIDLLQSPLYEIREQALWALGNIAGDGCELKDLLLKNQILPNILSICAASFDKQYVTNFNNSSTINQNPFNQFLSLLNTASWALSNLCRGSAPPNMKYLENLVKCLQYLLKQALSISSSNSDLLSQAYNNNQNNLSQRDEIILNVAWAFSYLTGYDEYNSKLVNNMGELGIIQQFVNLMDHAVANVRHPINRLIGNIVTGSDAQTKQCLNLGILNKYSKLLQSIVGHGGRGHISSTIREQREICWALSNICAGPMDDKLAVLHSELFPILIEYLQNKPYECAKEALWAISNATTDHDKRIIQPLVDYGVINALASFLRIIIDGGVKGKNKNKILLVALECIENILVVGGMHLCQNEENKYCHLLEECGIVTSLEDLQAEADEEDSVSDEVYDKCVEIMKKYFGAQCDDELQIQQQQQPQQTLDYGFNGYIQNQNQNNSNHNHNNNNDQQNENNNNNNNNENNNNNSNANGQFPFGVNSNSGSFGF